MPPQSEPGAGRRGAGRDGGEDWQGKAEQVPGEVLGPHHLAAGATSALPLLAASEGSGQNPTPRKAKMAQEG